MPPPPYTIYMKSLLWNDMSGNSIYSYSILKLFSRKLMRTKMTRNY